MAIIKSFNPTNVWKVFILNSISSTFVIFFAIVLKQSFDEYTHKLNGKIVKYTSLFGIIFTLIFTFLVSMLSYTIMYFVFGYGKEMVVNTNRSDDYEYYLKYD
jgi:hypothetical protein